MMQCHVAVSQDSNPQVAAQAVSQSVRQVVGGSGCDLACVFFSPHFSFDAQSLVETIRQNLAPRTLIGCMGSGVIGGDQEIEEHPGLVLWGIHHPGLQVVPLTLTPKKDGESLSLEGWPETLKPYPSPRTFLLFADPFSTPIDELFTLIDHHSPGSSAIGGIASGGAMEGESQLVLNDKIMNSGVVGVALQGGVEIRTVVSQGCQPIGERYVVTKVNRNVIQELGGIPPLERLEMTLKTLSEAERQQAAYGLQIGIAMDEHQAEFGQGDFLIRGLLGADRQSGNLAIAEFVQEGQTIQFHVRDAQAAGDDLNGLLTQERMTNPRRLPQGALLFSCHGRGQRFFEVPHHDIAAVHRHMGSLPLAGFFAGGEIGPVGGKNYLHGYTASIAFFYDGVSPES
ncbi:MAG: FIST N-terminal domain-containing protein [Nitrospirales bacterium]